VISKTEEYALRAVVCLARHHRAGPVRTGDLARETGIPSNYLSKILHQLGRHEVVASARGRKGGFRLARDPSEIALAAVIEPFGSVTDRERCVLGRPECSDVKPCGAHGRWKHVKEQMREFFAHTSVGDVMERGERGD
jgi:Rrf2 family iron-sulfur cluster assembly transcriptional regulator